jgi:hypothetical protein
MNQLDTALECDYIDENYFTGMVEKIKSAIRLLNGYIKYLQKRKENDR